MNLACRRIRRGSRESVTALGTADQSLHDARLNGAPAGTYFVFLEKFLGTGKALFRYQSRHGDFDPFLAGPFMARGQAGRGHASPSLVTHDTRPRGDAGFAKAGQAAT